MRRSKRRSRKAIGSWIWLLLDVRGHVAWDKDLGRVYDEDNEI